MAFILTPIVEYLLSLGAGGRHPVLQIGGSINLVAPPGFGLNMATYPVGSDYANIDYCITFDPRMMPDVFNVAAYYYGRMLFEELLSENIINNPISCFAVMTRTTPARQSFFNTSNLNQFYSIIVGSLSIKDEATWKWVVSILDDATKTMSGAIAAQAAAIVRQMREVPR